MMRQQVHCPTITNNNHIIIIIIIIIITRRSHTSHDQDREYNKPQAEKKTKA